MIFGASGDGRRCLESLFGARLLGLVEVVAFADNDSRMHGTSYGTIPIVSAHEVADFGPDRVIVTPVFYVEIKEQLVALGIPEDTIVPYHGMHEECFAEWDRETSFGSIGAYSYFKPTTRAWGVEIGRFCHIGDNCLLGLSGHDPALVTTYPLRMHFARKNADVSADVTVSTKRARPTRIGSDVYIGEGVVVYGGVEIGHGAVIGARSIVTRDIPPYAVAVGAPARVIRQRFSDDEIEALLAIRWWDWSVQKIRENLDRFEQGPQAFLEAHAS